MRRDCNAPLQCVEALQATPAVLVIGSLTDALAANRRFLLHLAWAQLHDAQLAEDVVQETALSAWQGFDKFDQRSSIRTWLVGILRFKIIDALRQRHRQPQPLNAMILDAELETLQDELLFDDQGRWHDGPHPWWGSDCSHAGSQPEQAVMQQQVMQVLQWCLSRLPVQTAKVFLMREYLGFDNAEVARQLGLQTGHIRVILMRARLALRTCLEQQMHYGAAA